MVIGDVLLLLCIFRYMMEGVCFFKFRYDNECNYVQQKLQNRDLSRIDSFIRASKAYGDDLHKTLEQKLLDNPDLKMSYHKNCVSMYTFNTAKYENTQIHHE